MNKALNNIVESSPVLCKGKIYRAHLSSFLNKRGEYVYQERMSLLKRKSCSGCPECGWAPDELNESISNGMLPIIDNIQDNALYSLKVVNITRDWETGYVDDYDLEFVKIKEELFV